MQKILLFLLLPFALMAQTEDLPIGFSREECELRAADYQALRSPMGITTPPGVPIRTAAEWEEVQALTIAWHSYPDVLTEIVRHARLECPVIIVCDDSTAVKNYLSNNGVDLSNVFYELAGSNSIWIRDYGQNTAYLNDVDSLVLVDWIYNRPRPLDDAVPQALADRMGLPLFSTSAAPNDLVHTGGNFMADGMGTAFSSELVLEENQAGNTYGVTAKTSADIDTIMKKFMGIHRYIKMPVLPYDGIHHIDMHIKLLDEETLLVGEYPAGVADGPQIEANLQYVLANYPTPFGTPYRVVRVTMPPGSNGNYPDAQPWWAAGEYRTYTNWIFVNKTILMPFYDEQYDTTAIRIIREAMPGYNVVGINADDPIQASGAIHCITHTVGVSDPLLIQHQPLHDQVYQTGASYTVAADIRHRSGIASATLYYRTDTTQPYTASAMNIGFVGDTWFGNIPDVGSNVTVYYYIHAEAVSGKTQNRPMPAPAGYWKFRVSEPTVGTSDVAAQPSMLAAPFPNPARAITCIPLTVESSVEGQLGVFDAWGRLVLNLHTGVFSAGEQRFFLDASTLAAGVYFIRWQTTEGVQYQRLVVR